MFVFAFAPEPILSSPLLLDGTGLVDIENYGYSVASAGDVNGDGLSDVAVSAPGRKGYVFDPTAGEVIVYAGTSSGILTSSWTVGVVGGGLFGYSLASADVNGDGFDDLAVGAPNGMYDGAVHVFHGGPHGLSLTAAVVLLTPDSEPVGKTEFGSAVASAGDVNGDGFDDLIVGEWSYDGGTAVNADHDTGNAHVYMGSVTGLETEPAWSLIGIDPIAELGFSVASAGDVNADGFDDVAIAAPGYGTVYYEYYEYKSDQKGKVQVFHGSAAGLATTPAWSKKGTELFGRFGHSVASAGDTNGDGFADLLVGSPDSVLYFYQYDSTTLTGPGRASLFLGSATGLELLPAWQVVGDQLGGLLGQVVAGAGDVNRDGYADVVIGSERYDVGLEEDAGRVSVYLGGPLGLDVLPESVALGTKEDTHYACSAASAGDVDGDGYEDIIVGENGSDLLHVEIDDGLAHVYFGHCLGLVDTDGDAVQDECDVCPDVSDPDQTDSDADTEGDACDLCPLGPDDIDSDSDGSCDNEDCDDADPVRYPGAPEICDGIDNACVGAVPADELDQDGDGARLCGGECDDLDPARFPGQIETCNGLDDDCDGQPSPDELDADRDHVTICDGDCDDADDRASPELVDQCGDAIDNDCDGVVDQACSTDGQKAGCTCNQTGGAGGAPLLAFALLIQVVRRRG